MPMLELAEIEVEYQIVYSSNRETIGIVVDKVNGLTISAPIETQIHEIENTMLKKQNWIINKIKEMDKILPNPKPKEFVSGERLTYIGRSYRLQINKGETKKVLFQFFRGKFVVTIPNDNEDYSERIRAKTIKWYREKAQDKIRSRIDFYALKVGKYPTNIKIREFKARWGTCQEDGSIDINWRIIMAPMSIIDYVIVHELCHLVAQAHSKIFWSKFSTIIIDHEQRREWLKINGASLTV